MDESNAILVELDKCVILDIIICMKERERERKYTFTINVN